MPTAPHWHGTTPGGKGRFPGFDVLSQAGRWDQRTAGVVLARVEPPAQLRFFTAGEQATAGALFDVLLEQRDEPKVPVLLLVDHRLAADETDGWFYDDMADDQTAWRTTLAQLDEEAKAQRGAAFHALTENHQAALVRTVQEADQWHGMAGDHVWSLWTRYACTAFYSHPWAWNEIGFGGPAYPRGYQALGIGKLEHWEVAEQAPPDSADWARRVESVKRDHHQLTGADGGHP